MFTKSSIDIRDKVAERVVRTMLPSLAITCGLFVPTMIWLYPQQPLRSVTTGLTLVLLLPSGWLMRRGRYRAAAAAMVVTLALAIMGGMLVNGGPYAPIYFGILPASAMLGWLYGTRAGVGFALGGLVFGAVTGWMVHTGALPRPESVGVVLIVMVSVVLALLTLLATVLPFTMAREALEESERARTALVEAEAKERRTHLAFDAVFDQTYELIGVLDPEGRILRANATALSIIGQPFEAVQNQPFWETPWWADEDRPAVQRAVDRAARGERVRFQTKHFDTAGRPHMIDFSLGPYRDETGEVVYLIPEGRDITDLVEAQSRLTQAQKMDAIGQLAGGIAHDFNNLLTGILGAAELLALDAEAEPGTGRRRVMIDTILKAGQRAADLTAQLLAFGRKGASIMEALHLNECVEAAVALLERTLDPSIRIVCEFTPENPSIVGDGTALENAILNLAINARDAMPEGGTLTLRTSVVDLEASFCDASGFDIPPGKAVLLSVEDTGVGIPPEHRSRLFEPFFTTKPAGTGLGLAAVFGAVVSHGGAILLDSEPGKGTTFRLYFHAVTSAEDAPALEASAVADFEGFRVLMADDDPIARATTTAQLEQLGFEVRVACDGEQALELFQDDPDAYEALVLDVIMPGMRGPAVAREALRTRPDLPVLLMSGYPREEDLSVLDECRGRFLRKPFSRVELVGTLSALLDGPVDDEGTAGALSPTP